MEQQQQAQTNPQGPVTYMAAPQPFQHPPQSNRRIITSVHVLVMVMSFIGMVLSFIRATGKFLTAVVRRRPHMPKGQLLTCSPVRRGLFLEPRRAHCTLQEQMENRHPPRRPRRLLSVPLAQCRQCKRLARCLARLVVQERQAEQRQQLQEVVRSKRETDGRGVPRPRAASHRPRIHPLRRRLRRHPRPHPPAAQRRHRLEAVLGPPPPPPPQGW